MQATKREQSGQPVIAAMSDADSSANPAATSQQGEGEQKGRCPLVFEFAEQTDYLSKSRIC